jgi:hypothetical protein
MDHNHSWSKQKPTVYINGERDRIELQSGKIRANILFPSLAQGIVPFINQFGRLWIGTLTQSFFEKKFHYERNLFVTNLESLKDVTSDQYILQKEKNYNQWFAWKSTAFYMWMCRVAQKETWRWPLLSHEPTKWTSGTSRLIATGMTKMIPWQDLTLLHFCKNMPSPEYLTDWVEIQSDEMLHDLFRVQFTNTLDIQETQVNWGITLDPNNTINMTYINNGTFHEDVTSETVKIWDSYNQWRRQYPTKPKIKIYTNWPKQIRNYRGIWDIVEIVPSQVVIDDIQGFGGRVGRLESWATDEYNNPRETVDHVLYVIDPRPIELGDLLMWMDTEHSTYIESSWKFLLYRKSEVYKNTYIDTSYVIQ